MTSEATFDVGPLSWVKSEIDLALDRASQGLQQFGTNPSDTTQLKFCRNHLHQVRGALTIVGLDGVTQFSDAVENLIADLESAKQPADAPRIALIGKCLTSIRRYLDDLLAGDPNQPLRLFDLYRQLAAARGLPTPSPSDLFYPDLNRRPQLPPFQPGADAATQLKTARGRYQKGLLAWLKAPDQPVGPLELRLSAQLAAGADASPTLRSFWWAASAFFAALGEKAINIDGEAKALCTRIDQQMKQQSEGARSVPDKLMRDVLFQVAIARSKNTDVLALRAAYDLQSLLPSSDTQTVSQAAQLEPFLKRLREIANAAEEGWTKFSGGAGQALAGFIDAANALDQGAERLQHTDFRRLTKAVVTTANWIKEDKTRCNETVSMEVATGVLLIGNAVENFSHLGADFVHQVDVMVARLHACIAGTQPPTNEVPMLDEMTRRAQEKLLMAQVVREIQSSLGQVEQALDTFFREPDDKSGLASCQKPIQQIAGALMVLGHPEAVAALQANARRIQQFAASDYQPDLKHFEDVARQLSALGFFVEALQSGAKDFAGFVRGLEIKPSKLEESIATQVGMQHSTQEPAPVQQAASPVEMMAPIELVAASEPEPAVAAMPASSLGATGVPSTAPANTAPEVDAELLEIFLEEATEVLGTITEQLEQVRNRPSDTEALTTLRRAFHTLKGSSRMVGLMDFGEVAWGVEQVHNLWLRQEKPVDGQLARLIELSHRVFSAWVAHYQGDGERPDASELVALSDQLKGGQTVTAPGRSMPSEAPAAAVPEAVPEAAADIELSMEEVALEVGEAAFELGEESQPEQAPQAVESGEPLVAEDAISLDIDLVADVAVPAPQDDLSVALEAAEPADIEVPAVAAEVQEDVLQMEVSEPEADANLPAALAVEADPLELGEATLDAAEAIEIVAADDAVERVECSEVVALEPASDSAEEIELVEEIPSAELTVEPAADELAMPLDEVSAVGVAETGEDLDLSLEEASAEEQIALGAAEPADIEVPVVAAEVQEDVLQVEVLEPAAGENLLVALAVEADPLELGEATLDAAEAIEIVAADDAVERVECSEVVALEPASDSAEEIELVEEIPSAELTVEPAADELAMPLDEVSAVGVAETGEDLEAVSLEDLSVPDVDGLAQDVVSVEVETVGLDTMSEAVVVPAESPAPEAAAPAPQQTITVSPVLYQIFVEEAQTHLDALRRCFGEMEIQPSLPTDQAMVRAAHTLGSISGTVGFPQSLKLGHGLEAALNKRDKSANPASLEALEIIRLTIAELESMVDAATRGAPLRDADDLISQLAEIYPLAPVDALPVTPAAEAPEPVADEPLPDDVIDESLLPIFIEEAADLVSGVNERLAMWLADPFDTHSIHALARLLHTLKGSARMSGAMRIGALTHRLESAIENAHRAGGADPALICLLQANFDDIAEMIDALADGSATPEIADDVLSEEAIDNSRISAPVAAEVEGVAVELSPEDELDVAFDLAPVEAVEVAVELPPAFDAGSEEAVVEALSADDEFSIELDVPVAAEALIALPQEDALGGTPEVVADVPSLAFELSPEEMAPEIALELDGAIEEAAESVVELAVGAPVEAVAEMDFAVAEADAPAIDLEIGMDVPVLVDAEVQSEIRLAEPLGDEPLAAPEIGIELSADEPAPVSIELPVAALEPEIAMPAPEPIELAQAPAVAPASAGSDDVLDPDLLPIFLEEAVEIVKAVYEQLEAWQAAPNDGAATHALARSLHTLKGSARMAGAMTLGALTHTLESRAEEATKSGQVSVGLIEEMKGAFDIIAHVIEGLQRGDSLSSMLVELPAPSLSVQVEAPAPQLVVDAAVAPAPSPAPAAPAAPAAVQPAAANRKDADAKAMLRVRADLVDHLVNDAGELSIARARIEDEMRSLKQSMLDLTENVIRLRRQLREIEIQAETQMASRVAHTPEATDGFDPLEMDRFTRFQEVTRMMAESVNDVATVQQNLLKNLDEANAALAAQGRLNKELQQALMSVRMVPFSTVSERLGRIVRQTAKELGKRADLDVFGATIELDQNVINRMVGPLEHLLRNAIAHGIEPPVLRVEHGKGEIGEIRLTLKQEGNEVIITMQDDGAGLNFSRIREKAISKGLMSADDPYDEHQLTGMIFNSGFSTAAQVSQVAGRGVGMDVVMTEVTSLGGRIEVHSETNKGSTFRIYLPLTLAVTNAVIVRVGSRTYAIPSSMVDQVQEIKEDTLATIRQDARIDWMGNRYPFHFLPHLLGEPSALPEARRMYWLMMLHSGLQRVSIQVDELMGTREVVVKNIGPQLARVVGVAGATVLGDGKVVLILNPVALSTRAPVINIGRVGETLPSVVTAETEATIATAPVVPTASAEPQAIHLPTIMVVDDSLTVRKVTGRLLAREGYQVITAKDGIDALEQLTEVIPDVILSDIEMPRMDGFELARNIRADERLRDIPIVMISSRTADKHRSHAAELGVNHFLGKPYQEEELLGLITDFLAHAKARSA